MFRPATRHAPLLCGVPSKAWTPQKPGQQAIMVESTLLCSPTPQSAKSKVVPENPASPLFPGTLWAKEHSLQSAPSARKPAKEAGEPGTTTVLK